MSSSAIPTKLPMTATPNPSVTATAEPAVPATAPAPKAKSPDLYGVFGRSDDFAKILGLKGPTDRGPRAEDASSPKAEIQQPDFQKLQKILEQHDAAARATIKSLR